MGNSLAKRSDITKRKYKFFINRIVIYFTFFLLPVFLYRSQDINFFFQSLMLLVYLTFMVGQWYLLGKEVDHRLKIYYRVNSSMDRTVYRVFTGSMVMLLFFNVVHLFPAAISESIFWVFFTCLGFFYSWPTRGKIIEDSMTNQFGEMKFLDSFEKTVFVLTLITLFFSLPELPLFENIDALKLYLDPNERVSEMIWSFMTVVYTPFQKYPRLYNLSWSFHFYFFGMGFFLTAFYGLLRHFVSRRLSILGVFAIVSSWSFSKILGSDLFSSQSTTLLLFWVWAVLWTSRSGTYRSGFFMGLVCAYMTFFDPKNIVFLPVSMLGFYALFLKEQTLWFKQQWVKYTALGVLLSLSVFILNFGGLDLSLNSFGSVFIHQVSDLLYRKAFYAIAPLGMILCAIYLVKRGSHLFTEVSFNSEKLKELLVCLFSAILIGIFWQKSFVEGFSMMWVLAFFALLPLEWIFQSISRLRSKRNIIYTLYILVCLLDSHLENRIRIVGKMFLSEEHLKYIIQL